MSRRKRERELFSVTDELVDNALLTVVNHLFDSSPVVYERPALYLVLLL